MFIFYLLSDTHRSLSESSVKNRVLLSGKLHVGGSRSAMRLKVPAGGQIQI